MALHGKQPGLLVAVFLPALLSTIVVILRTARKLKRKPSHVSRIGAITAESLIILGVISGWISGGFVLASVHYGFGLHEAAILAEPDGVHDLIKAAFWQTTGYSFNVGCYCLSVAGQVMHYRIWLLNNVDGYKVLNLVMVASGVVQVCLGAVCIISVFAKCKPVEANWNPTVTGKCWPENVFLGLNYASSYLTFHSYMIQAYIPLHLAHRLQKGKLERNKWTALCIMAFWNVIAGVLALVKLGYLHLYVDNADATYRRVILVEIGLAENGASGICPSAAEMWSLAQHLRGRHGFGSSQDHSGYLGSDRVGTRQSPPSNSSDIELTGHVSNAEMRMGIVKTTAWETTVDVKEDDWSRHSDQDGLPFDSEIQKSGESRLGM